MTGAVREVLFTFDYNCLGSIVKKRLNPGESFTFYPVVMKFVDKFFVKYFIKSFAEIEKC